MSSTRLSLSHHLFALSSRFSLLDGQIPPLQTQDGTLLSQLKKENAELKARLLESSSLQDQLTANTADHDKLLEKSKELMRRYKELKSTANTPPTTPGGPEVVREAQLEATKLVNAATSADLAAREELAELSPAPTAIRPARLGAGDWQIATSPGRGQVQRRN